MRCTISGSWLSTGLSFSSAGVQGGGAFEGQTGGGLIALRGDFAHQGVSAAVEVGLHAGDFVAVVIVGAALEARGEAHFHLGINAAGEGRVGMKVVDAAAHFEEVERVVGEFFRGGARGEGAVVEIASAKPAKARGDRGARIFIFQVQLEQRGETQTQPVGVSFRESGAQHAIEEKSGFEVGAGGGEFD